MVTITRNDDCRFREWVEHYEEYKSELYLHIIVDNASSDEYQLKLKESFPDSIIIELGFNGGCTIAYNAGIKAALNNPQVDAIALIANDIRMAPGNLTSLYSFLKKDARFGMVYPIILEPNLGSNTIGFYGFTVDKKRMQLVNRHPKALIESLPDFDIVESGPGGANLACREFYEVVGLQDENLFMYCDEVDTGIRGANAGFKLAVTKHSQCWHMHINPPGRRLKNNMAPFLMARNKVYLAKKYAGKWAAFKVFVYWFLVSVRFLAANTITLKDRETFSYSYAFMRGSVAGITGNMKNEF